MSKRMKKREKFLLIFMIVIIVLTIAYVVKGYVDNNKLSVEVEKKWEKISACEESEERCDYDINFEINGIIAEEWATKEHINKLKEEGLYDETKVERFNAVSELLGNIFNTSIISQQGIYGQMAGVVTLILLSVSITIFIYFMLTLEYKNIKQYIISNIIILLIFMGLFLITNLLSLPESILFNRASLEGLTSYIEYYDILLVLYLVFLTGNAIKNKNKLLIFNAIMFDLIAMLYIFVWHETFFVEILVACLPLLLIEGIIILIKKYKEETCSKN